MAVVVIVVVAARGGKYSSYRSFTRFFIFSSFLLLLFFFFFLLLCYQSTSLSNQFPSLFHHISFFLSAFEIFLGKWGGYECHDSDLLLFLPGGGFIFFMDICTWMGWDVVVGER